MKSWEREYMFKREGHREGETILQPIYDTTLKYAPDYDIEEILNELCPEDDSLDF